MEREYEAEQAAGGRTVCPNCGNRSVTHRSVITLGYEGHPGAEYSDFAKCERCDYAEL
jgi:predicted nucleic-acid-binding Zn-ribbon protein